MFIWGSKGDTGKETGVRAEMKGICLAPPRVWWGAKDVHREFRSRYNVKSLIKTTNKWYYKHWWSEIIFSPAVSGLGVESGKIL